MEQVAVGGGVKGGGPAWQLEVTGTAGVEPGIIGSIEREGVEEGMGVFRLVEREGSAWVQGDGVAAGGEPGAETLAQVEEGDTQAAAGVLRFSLRPEELTEELAGVGAGFERQIDQQGEFMPGMQGKGLTIERSLGVAV